MKTVLFVCVGNSGRSQMAEAYFNHVAPAGMHAVSAGTQPSGEINPLAVEVMREIGVDMSAQYLKLMTFEMVESAERAVSMGCGVAESCPALFVPSEDWQLDDPAGQPIATVSEIRDAVIARVRDLIEQMRGEKE